MANQATHYSYQPYPPGPPVAPFYLTRPPFSPVHFARAYPPRYHFEPAVYGGGLFDDVHCFQFCPGPRIISQQLHRYPFFSNTVIQNSSNGPSPPHDGRSRYAPMRCASWPQARVPTRSADLSVSESSPCSRTAVGEESNTSSRELDGQVTSTACDVQQASVVADQGNQGVTVNCGPVTTVGNSASGVLHYNPDRIKESVAQDMARGIADTPINRLSRLCRFNRATAVYELLDEKGPAHLKVFIAKVTLNIGGTKEEYTGEENSIQKAKHEAALNALRSPSLRSLPEKSRPRPDSAASLNTTPVGRLNALAIKMSSWADYQDSSSPAYHWGSSGGSGTIYTTSVSVQGKVFTGWGVSKCVSRNMAAQTALDYFEVEKERKNAEKLRKLPDPSPSSSTLTKAPVSMLYEECRRLALDVAFEASTSDGPPHCQTHHVKCTVGHLCTMGKGANKKLARRESAEKMLDQFRETFGCPTSNEDAVTPDKRKNGNLVKTTKARPEYGKNINPVSRLYQLQQANAAPDPVFEIDDSAGRAKEFVVTAKIPGGPAATAAGPNKKLAKRFAAESLMRDLGFQVQSPTPLKSAIRATKTTDISPEDRKVKFDLVNAVCDDKQDGRIYRKRFSKKPQPLSMYPKNSVQETLYEAKTQTEMYMTSLSQGTGEDGVLSIGAISMIAREFMSDRRSPTAVRIVSERPFEEDNDQPTVKDAWLPLLVYLCRVVNMTLKKDTFSRQGPHCEFVTVLTVGEPIESIGCGNGPTEEKAVEDAAWNLLTVIGEQGDETDSPNTECSFGSLKNQVELGSASYRDAVASEVATPV